MTTSSRDEKWAAWAKLSGYKSERELWKTEYEKHGSVKKLAAAFLLSNWTVQSRLRYNGIGLKNRGGANNQKISFDQVLYDRILREGLKAVAEALEVTPNALYSRRRKWQKLHPELVAQPPVPESDSSGSTEQTDSSQLSQTTDVSNQPGCNPPYRTGSSLSGFGSPRNQEPSSREEDDV